MVLNKKYSKITVLLLLLLMAAGNAMAQVVVGGSVYGGGKLADVKGNTEVNMAGGSVAENVFGGGKGSDYNYLCDKALVGVMNDGAGKDPTTNENKDKGTKVTITAGTVGTLNNGNLVDNTGNVYGGGEIGRVEWNTQVKIGVENQTSGDPAPVIYGSVFGAGAGNETHGFAALVRGNCTVTVQGKAKVMENVYGGGEMATAGRYWVKGIDNHAVSDETQPEEPEDLPSGMPYATRGGGACTVNVQDNAQIGPDAGASAIAGHIFGAGKGVNPHFSPYNAEDLEHSSRRMADTGNYVYFEDDPGENGKTGNEKYLEFLQTLALATETHVTVDESGNVKGNVYGGSESGFVQDNTFVIIQGGKIGTTTTYGNVFGGGKGLEDFAEAGKVKGNTNVSILSGSIYGNVYGGGELGDVGIIDKTEVDDKGKLTYNYKWKQSDGSTANSTESPNNNTGICKVNISGGTIGSDGSADADHGNVFGASRGTGITWWCEKAMVYSTAVSVTDITGGTIIYGTVYGGGEIGRVGTDAKVTIGTAGQTGSGSMPDIKGDVFGAGAGLHTHGYSALLRGNTEVTIQGIAKVGGSVYGGGKIASVGQFEVVGGLPTNPKSGGTCKVTIQGNAKIGSSGTENHVFGACKGVTPTTYDITNYKNYKSMQTVANGAIGVEHTDWDYYPSDHRFVWKYYRSEEAYHEFLHTLALTSHTNVSIEGSASVYGSVYGGGQRGITLGKVEVAITGGTIYQDVYGGGALADTNKGNWSTNKYVVATVTPGETIVTGMYTKSGTESSPVYTEITAENTKAALGTQYFIKGAWTDPEKQTKLHTTTVELKGGLIKGDAYGGGLGRLEGTGVSAVEAKVYGDINLSLGGTATAASSSATAFDITKYTGDYEDVVKSARIFGCNNLLGSPQGDVTVTVWKTVKLKSDGTPDTKPTKETNTYEVAAVYGGGNLAPFTTTGKKAHVIIHGCSDTSIETVYGGGNAAPVPETDVDIYSCYEIGSVFGGGNGQVEYTLDGGSSWNTNPGANVGFKDGEDPPVGGDVNTMIYGGTVHEAFGGSNKKGTIYGNVSIDVGSAEDNFDRCTLNVGKIVGAGKEADIEGDLKIIMGCKPNDKIGLVFGGADNANVNGNVELTVTSGNFGKVFGGNNLGGIIKGHIKLNIEETGKCAIPIKIDELYLGGNEAMYSMYGYYKVGDVYKARESADDSHPAEEGIHPVPYDAPELNIISCTHIGKVFGGGLGETAAMYADPTVNINMIPGDSSFKIDRDGSTGSDNDYHALGEIVDVYGGGNEATVYGNTTVNIGTATEVTMTSVNDLDQAQLFADDKEASYLRYKVKEDDANIYGIVEGAYITGNVYGGGKQADVTGNTYVNICAVQDDTYTTTDVIGYKGVSISGEDFKGVTIKGNVFGGGEGVTEAAGVTGAFECVKAMVGNNGDNDTEKNEEAGIDIMKESTDRGTRVSIGNGTVEGNVYGGGKIGRVEWNGVVTIGLPVGSGETSAPEIKGDVFGGGKGVEQYGYAALMRGNTFVTVQANAKVGKSVYGGGEIASVGKYKITTKEDIANPSFMAAHPGIGVGMPYSLGNEKSGYCNVIVRGKAEIGPDNMQMTKVGGPDDDGHVFGAGKGVLPYENEDDFKCQKEGHDGAKHPGRMGPGNAWDCYDGNEPAYLRFIETQALATHTEVLVGGNAFIKGSVYGGSLSGHVQHDTHVTIDGDCQIGAGDGINERYTDYYNVTEWPTNTQSIETSWAECAHWPFSSTNNLPHDPYAKYLYEGQYYYDEEHTESSNGGSYSATDGHTYYGNVFGGGSGVIPYRPGQWHREAGTVGGNTVVDITGGHILTNVYGGNEHTDVGTYDNTNYRNLLANTGKCIINMIGGTVGVPRTKEDIAAHPVTCYIFGAGKGDPRTNFNKWTNVGETQVNISGNARIYGSTFGGGEDGHVLGDVETNIGGTVKIGTTDYTYPNPITTENPGVIIGTHGLSGADGNIFGGGRGFSENALTAGVVCGNVRVNIHNGTMLGTVFGGGRLASVGTHLAAEGHSYYGTLIPDDKNQVIDATDVDAEGAKHGYIYINMYGGTIGATDGSGKLKTSDFSIGDVFGGCKGSPRNALDFGLSKYTFITMTGGTVNGNVYGGGEAGDVQGNTNVNIQGGIIAKNVFGGGQGSSHNFECDKAMVGVVDDGEDKDPDSEANKDKGTTVTISNGTVGTLDGDGKLVEGTGNVYGGGELGRVEWNTQVKIGVGTGEGTFAPDIKGSVFAAGAGVKTHGYSALVRGNSTVTVQGDATIGNSVYGGGKAASVGRYWVNKPGLPPEAHAPDPAVVPYGRPFALKSGGRCTVIIGGNAEIGTDGATGGTEEAGNVFAGSKGVEPVYTGAWSMGANGQPIYYNSDTYGDNYKKEYLAFLKTLAVAARTIVTIDGGLVKGSVYGGGELGDVGIYITDNDGYNIYPTGVGISTVTITGGKVGLDNNTDLKKGNVFGAGKGLDDTFECEKAMLSTTSVTISNGTVNGSVYGGGEIGRVENNTEVTIGLEHIADGTTTYYQKENETYNGVVVEKGNSVVGYYTRSGKEEPYVYTLIEASAPIIAGNVFGAGAGKETHGYSALVRGNPTVTIQGSAKVGKNVYGGGEIATAGRYEVIGGIPIRQLRGGECTVIVQGNAEIGPETATDKAGHVFGAGKGVDPTDPDFAFKGTFQKMGPTGQMDEITTESDYLSFLTTLALSSHTYVTIDGEAKVNGNVYGGSESGFVQNDTYIKMLNGTIGPENTTDYGNIFGGGLGVTGFDEAGMVKGNTTLDIYGGTINGSVYGGGALSKVVGSTNVNIGEPAK